MDPLIRSAEITSQRVRLSDARRTPDEPVRPKEDVRDEVERRVREEIEAEREREFQKAREAGYAAGVSDGKEAASAQLAKVRDELKADATRALGALEQAHDTALAELEKTVGEVAFAALCGMLPRHIASRIFTAAIIERTCAQLRTTSAASVRLHPRDIETLRELIDDSQRMTMGAIGLKVIADESLTLGGCVIESDSGRYDGSLESQLRRLHAALTSGMS